MRKADRNAWNFPKFYVQMKLVMLIVWLSRLAYAHHMRGNHIYQRPHGRDLTLTNFHFFDSHFFIQREEQTKL